MAILAASVKRIFHRFSGTERSITIFLTLFGLDKNVFLYSNFRPVLHSCPSIFCDIFWMCRCCSVYIHPLDARNQIFLMNSPSECPLHWDTSHCALTANTDFHETYFPTNAEWLKENVKTGDAMSTWASVNPPNPKLSNRTRKCMNRELVLMRHCDLSYEFSLFKFWASLTSYTKHFPWKKCSNILQIVQHFSVGFYRKW